uniref:FLP-16 protein n=2 Tax=Meloidogyne incognita TaxID=6306 RepID=A0A914KFC1_MELIC
MNLKEQQIYLNIQLLFFILAVSSFLTTKGSEVKQRENNKLEYNKNEIERQKEQLIRDLIASLTRERQYSRDWQQSQQQQNFINSFGPSPHLFPSSGIEWPQQQQKIFLEEGEVEEPLEENEKEKRAQTFVRFGKRAQTFVRFGKRGQTFVRFGRDSKHQHNLSDQKQLKTDKQ